MLKVLVASSKGGCGKSTIATNLAAYSALKGKATVLADADRQGSSSRWCEKRAELDTPVLPVDATRKGWQQRIPEDAERVIIDSGAGIRACMGRLEKEGAAARKGNFMIDAPKGFIKDGNKTRLRERDVYKITTVFNQRLELPKYSRFVSNSEIKEKNNYNLNIPRYVDTFEEEEEIDVDAVQAEIDQLEKELAQVRLEMKKKLKEIRR